MASGQEKDMAREEGPTAPNEVVNNAAKIDLNQDEAMADIELDDIEDLDLDLGDEHTMVKLRTMVNLRTMVKLRTMFNHNKTEVQPWLDLVDSTMILANVRPEARITAATRALDEVARRAMYGAKKQAQGPFEWPEFCTALKEAFMVKKSDLELRGHLESIKCRDRSVQKYAVELEAAARLLQKPLAEEEMMHIFMKGLPVNLQEAHMTGGMTNWTNYKEMKEQVIKTDNIIRTYIFGPEKTDQQPRAEGSGDHGNRPQNAKGGSGWNKRPFQQHDHQPGPQAKRPNGGGGHGPNKPDFSDKRCRGCGRMGHIASQCRNKNPIKYSGKPKQDGAGSSGKKDFQKPN
ncbi:unnamed protein product [Closterium sp. Naga37s-1]|nr:unnamed protein product [Closterium sp. Naga37s-1]